MGILDAPISEAKISALSGLPLSRQGGPLICGLLGDSRLYASHVTNGGTPGTTYPAGEVATTRDDLSINGIAHHLQCVSGGSVVLPRSCNWAISGQRTWEILGRTDAAIAGMLSAGARACVVLCSTNDRGAGGVTHVDSIANVAGIVAKLRAAGILAIVIAELPRGDSTQTAQRLSATLLAEHMMVRRAILAMHDGRSVIAVDCWSAVADQSVTTGDALLGYTYDGLHNNGRMSRRIAAAIWAQIASTVRQYSWAPAGPCDVWSATNTRGSIALNPCLTGSAGALGSGMTGAIADAWTGGTVSAGITCAAAKSAAADGSAQQTFVLGGTSTSMTAFDLMRRDTSVGSYGLAVGGLVRAVARLDLDVTSGLYELDVYCAAGAMAARAGSSAAAFAESSMPADAASGDLYITEPMAIPAGATTVRAGVRVFPRAAVVSANVAVRWIMLIHA